MLGFGRGCEGVDVPYRTSYASWTGLLGLFAVAGEEGSRLVSCILPSERDVGSSFSSQPHGDVH